MYVQMEKKEKKNNTPRGKRQNKKQQDKYPDKTIICEGKANQQQQTRNVSVKNERG